ncbi:unnamed protein product, partial [Prorocentrum cordatum]
VLQAAGNGGLERPPPGLRRGGRVPLRHQLAAQEPAQPPRRRHHHRRRHPFSRHTRSLPYRSEVESFNRAWTDTGRGGSRPKGLAHPSTFEDSRTRQILSRMPDLRLVFIICDPVGRVEKDLWWRHVCHEGRKPEGPCWSSLGAFLAAPEAPQELDKELMGERLQSLLELTGKRMRVLHPWGGPEAGTPGRAPGFCSPQENCRVQAPRTTVQRPGGAAVGSVGQFRVRSC